MTILKKKGKWEFGYKDTYSLDSSLGPIISSGLKKLHDILESRSKESKTIGIPNDYMKDEAAWVTDSDVQDWLNDLKKMIYAFEDKEPEIKDYSFKVEINKDAGVITCNNEEGLDLYREDVRIHQQNVQEGLNLFALRYKNLWW